MDRCKKNPRTKKTNEKKKKNRQRIQKPSQTPVSCSWGLHWASIGRGGEREGVEERRGSAVLLLPPRSFLLAPSSSLLPPRSFLLAPSSSLLPVIRAGQGLEFHPFRTSSVSKSIIWTRILIERTKKKTKFYYRSFEVLSFSLSLSLFLSFFLSSSLPPPPPSPSKKKRNEKRRD